LRHADIEKGLDSMRGVHSFDFFQRKQRLNSIEWSIRRRDAPYLRYDRNPEFREFTAADIPANKDSAGPRTQGRAARFEILCGNVTADEDRAFTGSIRDTNALFDLAALDHARESKVESRIAEQTARRERRQDGGNRSRLCFGADVTATTRRVVV